MTTTPRTALIAAVAAFAVVLAGCSSDDDADVYASDSNEPADDQEEVEPDESDAEPDDVAADEPELSDDDVARATHERFIAASDQFLRDGDVDALREVASGDAVDDLTALYEQVQDDGSEVAGFRTPQVQDVELVEDSDSHGGTFYSVTDCVVDQRRIFDPEISTPGLDDDDITKEWLRITTAVVIDDDGEATVAEFRDVWGEEDRFGGCVPADERETIEQATAELAVQTYAGMATRERADYEGVFEPQYIDTFFSRVDVQRLLEMDSEVGVRLIGADPYLASLVVCTYGFGQTLDATTGERLSGDDEWGDSRTAAEFLVARDDSGEFLVREVVRNEASDWTRWCQMGEVEFTRELNTLSDPSVVPDSDRINRFETGELDNS